MVSKQSVQIKRQKTKHSIITDEHLSHKEFNVLVNNYCEAVLCKKVSSRKELPKKKKKEREEEEGEA